MPYISQEKRRLLDPAIDKVRDALRQVACDYPESCFEGSLNYVISALIAKIYTKVDYEAIKDVTGVLDNVREEYYRCVAVPFENQKMHENGPVYPSPQM